MLHNTKLFNLIIRKILKHAYLVALTLSCHHNFFFTLFSTGTRRINDFTSATRVRPKEEAGNGALKEEQDQCDIKRCEKERKSQN